MESKLPKLSNLKKPTVLPKAILPTDRLKSNSTILKPFEESAPLTRDLVNIQSNAKGLKGGSPEIPKRNINHRAKLRRSRSACDLLNSRELTRPLKRHEPTLPDIPAKLGRFANVRTIVKKPEATSATSTSTTTKTKKTDAIPSIGESKKPMFKSNSGSSIINKTNNTSTTKSTAPITLNKKIPAYDYKARFADLLEKHKVLKEKFEQAKEQLGNLDNLPEKYEESQNQVFELRSELERERVHVQCLQEQNNLAANKITLLTKNVETLTKDYEDVKVKYVKIFDDYTKISKEEAELRKLNQDLTERVTLLTNELEITKDQLFVANMERKELHNTIMDLRGNIRVFCRVRPALENEADQLLCGWNYLDECSLEITNQDQSTISNGKNKITTHGFTFDHVFHPRSTQEDIFEMVSPLIQSALDGYNICIFAYGQTGSGKTYTMDGIFDNPGVIPRTVDLLFKSIDQYKRVGWEYQIKATFLEIYNEVLYDLLSNEQKEMEIRMVKNSKNDIYVSNITEEVVVNAQHLKHLMYIAKQNRATASTAGNERSSRSHAVTRIELTGRHEGKSETCIGTINLVDLAGSESPKTSIRMTETKNINRSLSELTNVILALLQKQDHIPYRNSKLTHLLMPSLGGNSKTLMFINVSPLQDCFAESVKSLRFAQSVNSCKVAKAKKNKYLNVSGPV